ncbi:MAG: alpha/beta hydrolase [Steroidobacter sp.]
MRKTLIWISGVCIATAVAIFIAFQLSPWPSALLIRKTFDDTAWRVSTALLKHVPTGISTLHNEHYDAADQDAYLDVFFPDGISQTSQPLPTIVWTHGGGWVSGSKDQITNYAKILAGKGYTVVTVDYSIAPRVIYPVPVRQVNAALAYLVKNAARFHVDPDAFFLAGDSAGAHISSQLANIVSEPSYAATLNIVPSIQRSQLRGVILYCGPYDTTRVNLNGSFGGFLKTILWAYSGDRNFTVNRQFASASVINYVNKDFPPVFISAGNADPLLPQSQAFADVLSKKGVPVSSLFFPPDYSPALDHEYQFDLDGDAGKQALDQSLKFIAEYSRH